MSDKTTEIFEKIKRQYDFLSSAACSSIKKIDNGYLFPQTTLALMADCHSVFFNNCESTDTPIIVLEQIKYIGDNKELLESEVLINLFYALANHYSPDALLFIVYKKQPDVDGDEGASGFYQYFIKIGNAIKYAQKLISEHFYNNKTRKINFPSMLCGSVTRCYDDGAYANSVVIEIKQLDCK